MEVKNKPSHRHMIFVDTDAYVALARGDDSYHARAVDLLRNLSKLPVAFCTSNYVFTASVTVISQRVSHQAALAYIKEIKAPQSLFTTFWVAEPIEAAALQLFAEQTSKIVSLGDCTNMAFLRNEKIE